MGPRGTARWDFEGRRRGFEVVSNCKMNLSQNEIENVCV